MLNHKHNQARVASKMGKAQNFRYPVNIRYAFKCKAKEV